jgi:plasmid maintenance system antidote protein VapI
MIYDISIPAGSGPFGHWLVTTLAKRDMRVDDLAFALGVTPPTVKRWCQNPQSLKMIQIIQITNVLVEDAVLWRVTLDKAVNLIVKSYDPNKSNNNYKNRRLPE